MRGGVYFFLISDEYYESILWKGISSISTMKNTSKFDIIGIEFQKSFFRQTNFGFFSKIIKDGGNPPTYYLKLSTQSIQQQKTHQNWMKNKNCILSNMWNFGIWIPFGPQSFQNKRVVLMAYQWPIKMNT